MTDDVYVGGVAIPPRVAHALAARGILESDGENGFRWTRDGRYWLMGNTPEVLFDRHEVPGPADVDREADERTRYEDQRA